MNSVTLIPQMPLINQSSFISLIQTEDIQFEFHEIKNKLDLINGNLRLL